MTPLSITPFHLAARFIGTEEAAGLTSNPLVLAMLRLDARWVEDDATPWCSAFVNWVAWLLRVQRSKSLAARSWLKVGHSVLLAQAEVGFDVVILMRGDGPQPGPEVTAAPGHVGFFAGLEAGNVLVLGGNQGDSVSVAPFHLKRVLGVRRIAA